MYSVEVVGQEWWGRLGGGRGLGAKNTILPDSD